MNDRLFVLQKDPQAILSLDPDGSGLSTVIGGLTGEPDGVQVDTLSGTLYWTNMGVDIAAADGTIERADLDGGNRRTLVGGGAVVTPKQLKLDREGGHLYWCDREGMRVMRCRLDGSEVVVLVRVGHYPHDVADARLHCVGIAIDRVGGHIYWSQKGPPDAGRGRIFRAGLDLPPGFGPDDRPDIEMLLDGLPEPIDLAIGAGRLYWTDRGNLADGNTLNRAVIGPHGLREREVVARGLHEGIGVALDPMGDRAFTTDLSGAVRVSPMEMGSAFATIASLGPLTGICFVAGDAPSRDR